VAVHSSDKLAAALYTLIFLLSREQFGHPAGKLFLKAQILMQDAMDGPTTPTSWPTTENLMLRQPSCSTAAATEAMKAAFRTVFFLFRWHWPEVVLPAFTVVKIT
jgi:hypothetical protein